MMQTDILDYITEDMEEKQDGRQQHKTTTTN